MALRGYFKTLVKTERPIGVVGCGEGGGGGRNCRFVLINRGCHRPRYRWGGLGFWVSGDRGSLAGRALSLAGSLLPVVMSGAGCPVIR